MADENNRRIDFSVGADVSDAQQNMRNLSNDIQETTNNVRRNSAALQDMANEIRNANNATQQMANSNRDTERTSLRIRNVFSSITNALRSISRTNVASSTEQSMENTAEAASATRQNLDSASASGLSQEAQEAASSMEQAQSATEQVNESVQETTSSAQELSNTLNTIDISSVAGQIRRELVSAIRTGTVNVENFRSILSTLSENPLIGDDAQRVTDLSNQIAELQRAREALQTAPGYSRNRREYLTGNIDRRIQAAQDELERIESEGTRVSNYLQKKLYNAIKTGLRMGANTAKSGFSNLIKMVNKIAKSISALTKKMLGLDKSFNNVYSGLTGLVTFANMWFQFMVIAAVFNQIKASMDTLAKSSEEFNQALSSMISSMKAFGAQLVAIAEPIINVLAPAMTFLLDTMTKVADTLSQFTARLTGNDMYTKATKSSYDYADSLDRTSSGAKKAEKAVKEYQNTVLGFDQLNKLNGIDNTEEDELISEPTLTKAKTQATALNKIADQIHDALVRGDYTGAGKATADAVNSAFEWVKNVAGWEANSKKIEGILRSIIDYFNGFVTGLNPQLIGSAIGDVMNTLIESLKILTDPSSGLDFATAGAQFGQMIVSFVQTVKWEDLGIAIVQAIQGAIRFVNETITTPDFWTSIGTAIRDGLTGMITAFDPQAVADLIAGLVNGLFTLLATAFAGEGNENIGQQIGMKLAETVNKTFEQLDPAQIANGINAFVRTITEAINTFVANVDWSVVLSTLGTVLGELDWGAMAELILIMAAPKIISGLLSGFGTIFGLLGSQLLTKVTTVLAPKIVASLGSVSLGAVAGIAAIVGIALYAIITHFDEFIDTIMSVGSRIGEIVMSILDTVVEGFVLIGQTIGGLLEGIFTGNWEQLQESLKGLGKWLVKFITLPFKIGLKVLSAAFDVLGFLVKAIGDVIADAIGLLGDWLGLSTEKVEDAVRGFVDFVYNGFKDIGKFLSDTADKIVDTVLGIFDKVGDFFGGIGDWFGGLFGGDDKKKKAKASVQVDYQAGTIPKLAGGGIVRDGQLFIANEAGPEMVGSYDGKTAVANNNQIVSAVVTGVKQAMMEAMMTFNSGSQGGGDIVLYVDSEELARASLKGQRQLERRGNGVVAFG